MIQDYQKTLKNSFCLKGKGLHTGCEVTMRVIPAPVNTGFVFIRTDLDGKPKIEADASYVNSTQRGTVLEKNGVKIHTCEHILAALVGMDLDNAFIELNALEPPILDGSSKPFVDEIVKAGILEQDAEREYFVIKEILTFSDPVTGSEITAIPSDTYEVTTMVDFGTEVLGTQNATMKSLSEFRDEFANARTFSFLHELETLIDSGLIKGGDVNNAIVYVDKELSQQTLVKLKNIFNQPEVNVQPNGILGDLKLHYPNEAARHKLLDVIGDLSLIGVRLKAKIIANKPGHFSNTQFAKKLNKIYKQMRRKSLPIFDLSKNPIYDIDAIMRMLPHRPPFLLVDKILDIDKNHIIGVKNVTINEPFFVGHFPNEPVMPGVMIVEAMAQTGGIFVLQGVDDPQNYSTYFLKIDKVRFKKKVVPGDTLIFKIDLISPIRRGIVHMQGNGYCNGQLVVGAEMMAQVTKNK